MMAHQGSRSMGVVFFQELLERKKFNDLIVSRRRGSLPAQQRIGATDEQPGVAKAAAGVSGTLGATQNHTRAHRTTQNRTQAHTEPHTGTQEHGPEKLKGGASRPLAAQQKARRMCSCACNL